MDRMALCAHVSFLLINLEKSGGAVYLPIINPIIKYHMKRTIKVLMGLVCGVLLSLSTSSCSKDEMNEKNLEGKWQSVSYKYKEYEADKLVDEYSQTCVDWYIGFNFKSDGTGQVIYYEEGESDTYQMTWVIMGDKLMVTEYDGEDSETMTYEIIEIKNNSMALSVTDEWTENGIKCRDILTYSFKKI